jgi:hypothetical protein
MSDFKGAWVYGFATCGSAEFGVLLRGMIMHGAAGKIQRYDPSLRKSHEWLLWVNQ